AGAGPVSACPLPRGLANGPGTGELPMTPWGFRAMSGPFERLGPARFTACAWAFGAVCGGEVTAGVLIWRGDARGRRLAVALTPPGVVLGLGFALPIYLASIPLRI